MIAQGTDAVSRGSLKQGVTLGLTILQLCPWGKSSIQAETNLLSWIKSWSSQDAILLEPSDWFIRGHDCYIRRWWKAKKSSLPHHHYPG